jgi:NagD protein
MYDSSGLYQPSGAVAVSQLPRYSVTREYNSQTYAYQQLMSAKFGVDPATAIMIGDRLDTDVAFGNMAGVSSALVLTGVTTREALENKVRVRASVVGYCMQAFV